MDTEHAVVPPDWPAISIACSAGLVVGLFPYLLYVQAVYLAAPLFIYVAIVVPWKGRAFVSHATERPDWREWLLAGWTAVGTGATASFVGFIWHAVAYLVAAALAWVAPGIWRTWGTGSETIAMFVSAFIVGVFALVSPILLADQIPGKLYPRIAGTRSVFFPVAARPWRMAAVALLSVTAVVAGISALDVHGLAFTLSLTFLFVLTAAPLVELGKREQSSDPTVEAIARLRDVLAAAGYELTEKPGTGNPELDPLIAPIDILAFAPGRGLAIKVIVHGAKETEVDWSVAFDVRMGAMALQRALREGGKSEAVVEPYLLVIGGHVGDDLRAFAETEAVRLVPLPDIENLPAAPLVDKAIDPDHLESALRLLQLPWGNRPDPAGASGSKRQA